MVDYAIFEIRNIQKRKIYKIGFPASGREGLVVEGKPV
jgi:hypothetical protein